MLLKNGLVHLKLLIHWFGAKADAIKKTPACLSHKVANRKEANFAATNFMLAHPFLAKTFCHLLSSR